MVLAVLMCLCGLEGESVVQVMVVAVEEVDEIEDALLETDEVVVAEGDVEVVDVVDVPGLVVVDHGCDVSLVVLDMVVAVSVDEHGVVKPFPQFGCFHGMVVFW